MTEQERIDEVNAARLEKINDAIRMVAASHGYAYADELAARMLAEPQRWAWDLSGGGVSVADKGKPLSLAVALAAAVEAQPDAARFKPETKPQTTQGESQAKIERGLDLHEREARRVWRP